MKKYVDILWPLLAISAMIAVALGLSHAEFLPETGRHLSSLMVPNLLVGAAAGVLAGLLGIGGGLVIVPMLVFTLEPQGISKELVMHLALGTSMASIIFTSVSSSLAHHHRDAVRWDVVKRISVGILLGSFLGTFIAGVMSMEMLKIIFVIFVYYVAVQMLMDFKPKPTRELPCGGGLFCSGGVIGAVSSLVGIGGGTLSVPFMVFCNLPIHTAIGTASAIGFPIAVAGTIGYVANGLTVESLPPFCLGYIYLPALFGIICASVLTAPLGARLSHSLPVPQLKKVFAVLLILVGSRMIYGLIA